MTDESSSACAAYELLLTRYVPLRWDPPWHFLPGDPDCYGPVADPNATLLLLQRRFAVSLLQQAGLVHRTPWGEEDRGRCRGEDGNSHGLFHQYQLGVRLGSLLSSLCQLRRAR